MTFEKLLRSFHILKYTTQLISDLLGFLSDSVELESATTTLAMSLTMQTFGKIPYLKAFYVNALKDTLQNKAILLFLHKRKVFAYNSKNTCFPHILVGRSIGKSFIITFL
jgi:hypothetical protein